MSDSSELIHHMYELLSDPNPANTSAALEIALRLAENSDPIDMRAAQAICDAAYHGESLPETERSVELYGVLLNLASCPNDFMGRVCFRHAQCLERNGDWTGASRSYRRAAAVFAETGIKALAQFRLAVLMIAAEEYGEAVELLESVCAVPDNPHVDFAEARYQLARAMSRARRPESSRAILEGLAATLPDDSAWFIPVHQLMAENLQAGGDAAGAAGHLRAILGAPGADPQFKSLVYERLARLPGEDRPKAH